MDSTLAQTSPTSRSQAAPGTRRIAICLQYDGSAYCGWQRQPHHPSVQETLEGAIAQLDPHRPATAVAAGSHIVGGGADAGGGAGGAAPRPLVLVPGCSPAACEGRAGPALGRATG